MTEPTTLGADLRRERERRGLELKTISEKTKLSISLLEGLEADDISRWPGGIFRRAFVRSYSQCVGIDADAVIKRFEKQFPPEGAQASDPSQIFAATSRPGVVRQFPQRPPASHTAHSSRARLYGTAADLTVAVVIAFGSAAAGSRLLWPVLLIACYYAIGVLISGTSPMVALLSDGLAVSSKPKGPTAPAPVPVPAAEPVAARQPVRARLAGDRPVRQRRGMQAPV